MEDKVLIALIGFIGVVISSVLAYIKGQKNPKVDQFQAINDSYESFIEILKKDNADLRARVMELERKLAAQ